MKTKHLTRKLGSVLLLIGALAQATFTWAADTQLIGEWQLDIEGSAAIAPEQPQEKNWFKNQNVRTSVNIGGIPLPRTGGRVPEFSNKPAKDPNILRCKEMIIEPRDGGLAFTYVNVGSDFRKKGKYRGAKIRWDKDSLSETYKSTTRKVTQKFEIQDNGQLLVTVKINPNKGLTRTYLQLFNRKP